MQGEPRIKVLIVDDVAQVREALDEALRDYPRLEVVGTAKDGAEGVRLAKELQPDVVLMDLRMPEMNGIRATRAIAQAGLPARVLMLTAYDDESLVRDAMDAGAAGYLVKGTLVSDTVAAIEQIASDYSGVTRPS